MHNKIIGIEPRFNTDLALIKNAGIEWIRQDFVFPFSDKVGGLATAGHLDKLREVENYHRNGIKIMGTTPLIGYMAYEASAGRDVWHHLMPEWAGDYKEDIFYKTYEDVCEAMARETAGTIDMWQIDNEMDIEIFRGPLSIEQAARLLAAGARGIKRGNPAAKTSINPAWLHDGSIYLFKELYHGANAGLFDYAGIDGYFGSWSEGGPEAWTDLANKLYELTGKPVIVHEWGYSAFTREPAPGADKSDGVCKYGWINHWKNGHTEEEQAEYVDEALKLFARHPHIAGSFFFMWGDPEACFHCGQKGCPSECSWGLQKIDGTLRKAYYAFKDAVAKYY